MNEDQEPEIMNDAPKKPDPMKAVFEIIGEIEELSSILGVLMEWDKASPMSRKLTIERIDSSGSRLEDVAYNLNKKC